MAQVKTCSSSTSMPRRGSLRHHVAAGPLAVVGQEAEGDVGPSEVVDEAVRPGDQLAAPVQHPVHVDQESKHQRHFSRTMKSVKRVSHRTGRLIGMNRTPSPSRDSARPATPERMAYQCGRPFTARRTLDSATREEHGGCSPCDIRTMTLPRLAPPEALPRELAPLMALGARAGTRRSAGPGLVAKML